MYGSVRVFSTSRWYSTLFDFYKINVDSAEEEGAEQGGRRTGGSEDHSFDAWNRSALVLSTELQYF